MSASAATQSTDAGPPPSRTAAAAVASAFYRKAVPISPPPRIRPVVASGLLSAAAPLVYDSISDSRGNYDNNTKHTSASPPSPPVPATHHGHPQEEKQQRHLTLWDLLAVGLGGTLGSGLFVLAGLVAHRYAGPAAVLSWGLAGGAATLSAVGYAELSSRIHISGSAYAYSYVALGELPAVLAATCLSLEYVVASAAVARSWGDKVVLYLHDEVLAVGRSGDQGLSAWVWVFLGDHESCFSPCACLISTATVALLLCGMHESKRATTFFTVLKLALVLFMIVFGFLLTLHQHQIQSSTISHTTNSWTAFAPMGFGGILRGSVGTFFGFLGYDQVVGLAGEAIDPKHNLPRAVLLTLASVTIIYMSATLALVGMQNWNEISPVSGFPHAFAENGAQWAGHLTALGEIVTLPIVLLVTVQVQPRLQQACAQDGLISSWFAQVDDRGNLRNGTCFAGAVLILFSTFVPFTYLNDTISCAVLSALNLSNSSLVLMWHEHPKRPKSRLPECLLVLFHVSALLAALSLTQYCSDREGSGDEGSASPSLLLCTMITLSALGMIVSVVSISYYCPRTFRFGGQRQHPHGDAVETTPTNNASTYYFTTPWVPYWPCLGIFVNWYLIAQLEFAGVAGLLALVVVVVTWYFVVAVRTSRGGRAALAALFPASRREEEIVSLVVR